MTRTAQLSAPSLLKVSLDLSRGLICLASGGLFASVTIDVFGKSVMSVVVEQRSVGSTCRYANPKGPLHEPLTNDMGDWTHVTGTSASDCCFSQDQTQMRTDGQHPTSDATARSMDRQSFCKATAVHQQQYIVKDSTPQSIALSSSKQQGVSSGLCCEPSVTLSARLKTPSTSATSLVLRQ
jgi:hypothetical protein